MTKELIKIEVNFIGDEEVNAVDARELHETLGLNKDFSSWIKSYVEKLQLVENIDYCLLPLKGEQNPHCKGSGGHNKIDYIVTLDIAKNIALMTNTDMGQKVRTYFIEFEKQYKKKMNDQFPIPQNYGEALKLAAAQWEQLESQKVTLKQQETKLVEQEPKVEFYDTVVNSEDTVDMATAAKLLNKKLGRNKLFQLLRDKEILMKNNQPYQQYIDAGYFRTIESQFICENGDIKIYIKTVILQKGLDYIRKILKDYILDL